MEDFKVNKYISGLSFSVQKEIYMECKCHGYNTPEKYKDLSFKIKKMIYMESGILN